MSATGLEADGPPDAALTHRLALIAEANRQPDESLEAGSPHDSQTLNRV